jgi:DNA repair protein RAD50
LDEPNKEGLANALADLIATRTKQQNFQILLITHDLDFVRQIRNQLGSKASVTMPEFYFRVARKEAGRSGKFFSHIERIPLENM